MKNKKRLLAKRVCASKRLTLRSELWKSYELYGVGYK